MPRVMFNYINERTVLMASLALVLKTSLSLSRKGERGEWNHYRSGCIGRTGGVAVFVLGELLDLIMEMT